MAPLCIRNRARADSTQIMDWKAENPREILPKRDLDTHNVKNFRCLLVVDTVEKLCFEMSGDFICDLNGIAYCMYEGVAEVV